jgi:hypothetical protein
VPKVSAVDVINYGRLPSPYSCDIPVMNYKSKGEII